MKYFVICILFVLTVFSCKHSDEVEVMQTEEVDCIFSLNIPSSPIVSLKSYDDNSIRCIDLLIFDEDNKFIQRILVNNVSGAGSAKTFTVRLAASREPRTFYIVANGRDKDNKDIVNFDDITDGMIADIAIPLLVNKINVSTQSISMPSLPLIMSGKATVSNISSTTTINAVNMLRVAASIQVECTDNSMNNGLDDFELIRFTLQQSANKALIFSDNNYPETVSLSENLDYIDYADNDGVGEWGIPAELYLYERTNFLDNTGLSVIIHGKYKGVEGYYKVWLKDNMGRIVHIIRNHRYLIRITKVFGAGYASFEEAILASHPANIFTEIIDDNDDISDIIVDGKYELGISSNLVEITGSGIKPLGIVFNTNHSSTLKIVTDVDWITDVKFIGTGFRQAVTASFSETNNKRTGYLTLRVGSLSRTMKIIQSPE